MKPPLPSPSQLRHFYNDKKAYSWTEKSLDGEFDPLDMARKMVVKEELSKRWHELPRRPKVLDLGCGSGIFAEMAAKLGADTIGVDISEIAVEKLNIKHKNNKNLSFKVSVAEKLPFKDATFDLIMCFEVLEHLRDPQKALNEIKRVIKPRGLVLISVPNWFGYDRLLAGKFCGPLLRYIKQFLLNLMGVSHASHLHYHSPKDWQYIFSKKLRVLYQRPLYVFPFIPELPGFLTIIKKTERRFFSVVRNLQKQQSAEKKLLRIWPFFDLGQSHLWILKN